MGQKDVSHAHNRNVDSCVTNRVVTCHHTLPLEPAYVAHTPSSTKAPLATPATNRVVRAS